MTRIEVALGDRSYPVLIEDRLLEQSGPLLAAFARGGRLIVISDENVWAAQGPRLQASCTDIRLLPIVVPAGEGSKSWETLAFVVDRLLGLGIERTDHVVALGGGVIGDLVGFAAAIVNRGCGFVQIPTSLLAQVDSSVGGKTAINVAAGKNLVGAFHQPLLVLIDPYCLQTLDGRHVRSGYAEIAKYALIEDADLFDWLEGNAKAVLAGEAEPLRRAIAAAVAGKARIVAEDERETSGRRALLNLGHTFGHALEAETGYGERLFHGEAVAIGMTLAFDFSVERGLCPAQDAERVRAHLGAVGLPTSLAEAGIDASGGRLVEHMMHDKKKQGGRLPFILVRGIGRAFVDKSVEPAEVEEFLNRQTHRLTKPAALA